MFYEIRFPELMDYNGSWGPWWQAIVRDSPGGHRRVDVPAGVPRGRYTLSLRNRTSEETRQLLHFFYAVGCGRANGFRLHDLAPGEDTGTDEPLGVGNGTTTTFQLYKRYTLGSYTFDRVITKPVAVSQVTLNGTPTALYTVSTITGVVTMASPPAGGVVLGASFTFDVPVRFDTDALKIRAVEPGIYNWEQVELQALREHAQV